MIADQILKEIRDPAGLPAERGAGLSDPEPRAAGTLSGGESQRIRLATQIGSSLMGVLYILDEPSIGLHQRDNDMLLATLKHLRDLGNTLIVVEHDEDTMRAADYIVDVGPGAGVHGGQIVAAGTAEEVDGHCRESITGDYLAGRRKNPGACRPPEGQWQVAHRSWGIGEQPEASGCVRFPWEPSPCVTGVSGSRANPVWSTRFSTKRWPARLEPSQVPPRQA